MNIQKLRVLFVALLIPVFVATYFMAPHYRVVPGPAILGEILVEADPNAPAVEEEEILWLARCIYSETKQPNEQELVAWVVRNRVETEFRGRDSYREVVLDPWQFSAFNMNSPVRSYYAGLHERSTAKGWQTAIGIARDVIEAPAEARPFSEETRHFYSARSMRGGKAPGWARNQRPVKLDRHIDPDRFRFYAGIS